LPRVLKVRQRKEHFTRGGGNKSGSEIDLGGAGNTVQPQRFRKGVSGYVKKLTYLKGKFYNKNTQMRLLGKEKGGKDK